MDVAQGMEHGLVEIMTMPPHPAKEVALTAVAVAHFAHKRSLAEMVDGLKATTSLELIGCTADTRLMSQQDLIFVPMVLRSDWAADLGLPPDDRNIFQRIIRNPHPDSDTPKERECAEMLAVVLMNCPSLRATLLAYMGKRVGLRTAPWDKAEATTDIDTELSVSAKRDDIRITVTTESGLALLWSLEVKVGASFHVSSSVEMDADPEIEVHQILNYDRGLLVPTKTATPTAHVAGFVLALSNMQDQMPAGLASPWNCMTWTEIGRVLEESLIKGKLAEREAFLAKHLLGFIKLHLWRMDEMSDMSLDVDDVSFLKAVGAMAVECEQKVNSLVGPLLKVVEEELQQPGEVTHQKSLLKSSNRSVVYLRLVEGSSVPYLFAGIVTRDDDGPKAV